MIKKTYKQFQRYIEIATDPTTRENIITIAFGWSRRFVNMEKLRYNLNGAAIGKSANNYVPMSAFYGVIAGIVSLLVAIITIPIILTYLGESIPEDIELSPILLPFDITVLEFIFEPIFTFLLNNIELLTQIFGSLFFAIIVAIIVFTLRIYKPSYIKNEREREIDEYYSISVLYLYALTKGGRSLYESIDVLKDQDEIFKSMSEEAQTIYRRVELSNVDIIRALRIQSKETPSERLSQLYVELASTIEQGASVSNYLEEKSRKAEREEQRRQEQKFELLESMNQVLMISIITPTLVVVTALAGAFIGGGATQIMNASTIMPLVLFALFGIFLYILFDESDPDTDKLSNSIPKDYRGDVEYSSELAGWQTYKALKEIEFGINTFFENPYYTFIVTVPFTVLYMAVANPITILDIIISNPVTVGFVYFWIPYVILFIPYILVYEIKSRRRRVVREQLTSILTEVAESHKQGNKPPEAFKNATERRTNNLEKTINDEFKSRELITPILTKHTYERIGNSYESDRLRIAMKILSDTTRETGNISDVLQQLIRNLRRKEEADSMRRTKGLLYSTVMLFTSLVTIGILVVVDIMFLGVIEDVIGDLDDDPAGIGLTEIPIENIRAVLFYISFNTMFSVGGLVGLLMTSKLSNTLKYILIFTLLPILVFLII